VDATIETALPRPRTLPVKGAGTILLVEDDDAVRHVTARILRDNGYTVLETRRPSEARVLCAESKTTIDLLLTDIVMPETSGPKLAQELSSLYPSLHVLYMSGYSGVAPLYDRSVSGEAAYIEKPFAASALVEKVREAMRGTH
jgi:DNA-binding NtrC family response regulator